MLELLRQYGWNATSFQVLEPGFRYWFGDDHSCVAYVDTGGAWVAAGAPIADVEQLGPAAGRFVEAARNAGRRVCFFAVEERFVERSSLATLGIGQQPVWDSDQWNEVLRSSRSLREQLRRARAKGVQVRELSETEVVDPSSPARRSIQRLIDRWSRSRSIAPMGFLVALHPFSFAAERHYFVAERDGQVFGFLAVAPVYGRHGWFFEDFLRDPAAPNGTIELLVHHAMESAAGAGCHFVTLGLAPLAGDVNAWLTAIRDSSGGLYDFEGLRSFKAKLRPQHWEPIFVAYPRHQTEVLTVVDVLSAFSRVGLFRFGLETLLRVPAIVVKTLAGLLVPWMVLLALAPTPGFFPSRSVQFGWIAFDAVLFVALWILGRRWRPRLATVLALAVTTDALLTLAEVIVYNVPRAAGAWDVLALVVAVLAPTFAAVLLWRARLQRAGLPA